LNANYCHQEIAVTNAPIDETENSEQTPEKSPTDTSKPIGSAIPAPIEPGLDQPLPEKNRTQSNEDESAGDESCENPIGETEPPPGVPPPGPSDFA
jgi:hypothetical protein